jgi:hypothetical protein
MANSQLLFSLGMPFLDGFPSRHRRPPLVFLGEGDGLAEKDPMLHVIEPPK